MTDYNTNAHQSVVYLEQALEGVLAVARAHEPAEVTTPERLDELPLEWDEAVTFLEAIDREQHTLYADMLRTAVVLRQMHASYVIATSDDTKSQPQLDRRAEA